MCTADVNKFALDLAGMQDVSAWRSLRPPWRTLGLKVRPPSLRGSPGEASPGERQHWRKFLKYGPKS